MSNIDYGVIPTSVLRQATVAALSYALNPLKVIPNEKGLPRDWRGLAHLLGLTGVEVSQLSAVPDPTTLIFSRWFKGTVKVLIEYLEEIDRFDVIDDTADLICQDCEFYQSKDKQVDRVGSSSTLSNIGDELILTVDDVGRLEQGLEPQIYDAYLLYVDEDVNFASEIVQVMEEKYNMKFCIRDRDLVAGITFEHDAIMKLIAERCRRLIVVVSSHFLKSTANKFFVTFAQAIGIDQRQRKVVPILYERCQLPPELSYYFLLDYSRAGKLYNFWERLRDSIQTPKTPEPRLVETKETKSDIWMSKTEFVEEPTTPDPKVEPKTDKSQEKKRTVYKMMKQVVGASSKKETSTSFMSSLVKLPDVPFENFSNSSSFESQKDEKEKPTEKKKKWFKRKNIKPILS